MANLKKAVKTRTERGAALTGDSASKESGNPDSRRTGMRSAGNNAKGIPTAKGILKGVRAGEGRKRQSAEGIKERAGGRRSGGKKERGESLTIKPAAG
jgi:hypothetical protein